jgi:hypothetical protein
MYVDVAIRQEMLHGEHDVQADHSVEFWIVLVVFLVCEGLPLLSRSSRSLSIRFRIASFGFRLAFWSWINCSLAFQERLG